MLKSISSNIFTRSLYARESGSVLEGMWSGWVWGNLPRRFPAHTLKKLSENHQPALCAYPWHTQVTQIDGGQLPEHVFWAASRVAIVADPVGAPRKQFHIRLRKCRAMEDAIISVEIEHQLRRAEHYARTCQLLPNMHDADSSDGD